MDLLLDSVVSIIGVIMVALYSWSLRAHFKSDKMSGGAILISVMVVALALVLLYLVFLSSQPLVAQLVGLAMQLSSAWLFFAAIKASREGQLRFAFDPGQPRSLVTWGPYRWVRHPFYVSYILFWAGWSVATWSLWPVVPIAILIVVYVVAALGEERLFVGTQMAASYAEYRRRTGFFFPKFGAAQE
ncbi:MAG: Nickel-cobalt-cadmium resistance protein [Devosia sp.]|nr:Nickel-cobalt-cadmium resistance protein [Devosia sp.]